VLAGVLSLGACSLLPTKIEREAPLPSFAGAVSVSERYQTARDPADNVDSVAVWHGPKGEHWLIATAKTTDRVLIYDAVRGTELRKFGVAGTGLGQFERPNGVFVIDDLAFVVERDNRRVQLLQLPDLKPLLQFGSEGEQGLKKPYGLWVQKLGDGSYRAFVTDNYETADGLVPPPAELGARVQQFRVRQSAEGWRAERERRFGATAGDGVLNIVESVWGDPLHGRLLIADEEQYRTRDVKVYGFDGQYRGPRLGGGTFRSQPEGIALYACADGSGWWVLTDQGRRENHFLVYDRRTLEYRGAFSGPRTRNTDGIWLTQTPMPGFPHGGFFAVHDDGNVSAFDLGAILDAVGAARCRS